MARPERSLDPDGGPVEALAVELRNLRAQAGGPGYRVLSGRAGFSAAALANAAGGRQLPTLAVTLAFVRACGGDPGLWERRWRQAAAEAAARQAEVRHEAGPNGGGPGPEQPPYRGLMGYGVDDGDWFFGRRRIIAELARMLDRQRFVAVFGASGSGKSSLLRAGLIPRMRGEPGPAPVLITPGAAPMNALRRATRPPPEGAGLLVVDQFEEVFTQCADPSARAAFVAELAALVSGARARVVIGVRADFYPRCAELPVLAGLLAGANVPVGPLCGDELREVVVEPARRAGLSVERALVTRVLADAAGQPGCLPLISHALLETWRHRRGGVLTAAAYEAAGGMVGAIAQTAEIVYQRFDPPQREVAEQVLTRLVTLGEGVADTRRRIDRAELDGPRLDAVLRELAAARLVVLGADTVEIAHESLVEAWPRLHGWLHADRETLRLHRRLTEDSRIWDSLGRDTGALYRGARLAAWDGRGTDRLNGLERAFLATSRDRQAREADTRRRRVRLAVATLAAGVVVTSVLAAVAVTQAGRANAERDVALSRQLVANARDQMQTDQELALLLAREAYDVRPTAQTRAAVRQAVADSRVRATVVSGQGQVYGVAYTPDGRRVAASGADGTVRVWSGAAGPGGPEPGPRVLRGHHGHVWSPVFSRDGRWLAACGVDGTVTVWDTAVPAEPVVLRGHAGVISGVAFSADSRRIASAGADGAVRVWDRAGRGAPRVLRTGSPMLGVAFSPDGSRLAAGGQDGAIRIWDARRPGAARVLRGHDGSVEQIAFSPDGARLGSGGSDGTVRVWEGAGPAAPLVLRAGDGTVETVAFSPDGLRIASGHSGSDTVRVWSAVDGDGDDPLELRGHDGPVWSVAFSPDGRRLASGSGDGTIRFWDAAHPGHPTLLHGHRGPAWSVAASADGAVIASGGRDGTVRVWRHPPAPEHLVLRGHDGEVLSVAVSPDGGRVAGAGADGTVRVWGTAGGAPTVLRGHRGAVWGVSFSPDGTRLASGGSDGMVRIRDAAGRGAPVELRGHDSPVHAVAFSPDGRRVASGGQDGTVHVWDGTGRGAPLVLAGQPGLVWTVAFSRDGRWLVSGGDDGVVRLWDPAGRGRPTLLRGHRGPVWSVAVSPDGARLASAGHDGTLRLWHTAGGEELVVLRGHGRFVEQVALVPGDRLLTANGDGTVRMAPCEVCGPIGQVRAAADAILTRSLTAEERRMYLSQPSS